MGHEIGGCGRVARNAQRALLQVGHLLNGPARLGQPFENGLGFLEEVMRLRLRHQPLLLPLEKGKADFPFQPRDGRADSGLRPPQAARRLRDRADAHDLGKGLKLADGQIRAHLYI